MKHILDPGSRGEVKYVNRVRRRETHGVEKGCGPKHARMLIT